MVALVAIHIAIGLALGVLTSIPIGVANVAVVDAGLRSGRRRALGIAAGAAMADAVHSGVAFTGMGLLLNRHPLVPAILFMVSGALITGYGVHALRTVTRHQPAAVADGGFFLGLALTGLNPAPLLAWVVVAGALALPSALAGVITAAGVGAGAFACFAVFAHLAARGRDLVSSAGSSVSRWVGAALIVLGVISVGRGVYLLALG